MLGKIITCTTKTLSGNPDTPIMKVAGGVQETDVVGWIYNIFFDLFTNDTNVPPIVDTTIYTDWSYSFDTVLIIDHDYYFEETIKHFRNSDSVLTDTIYTPWKRYH